GGIARPPHQTLRRAVRQTGMVCPDAEFAGSGVVPATLVAWAQPAGFNGVYGPRAPPVARRGRLADSRVDRAGVAPRPRAPPAVAERALPRVRLRRPRQRGALPG